MQIDLDTGEILEDGSEEELAEWVQLQTPPTHPFPLWEFNWTGFLARLAGSKDCFFRD